MVESDELEQLAISIKENEETIERLTKKIAAIKSMPDPVEWGFTSHQEALKTTEDYEKQKTSHEGMKVPEFIDRGRKYRDALQQYESNCRAIFRAEDIAKMLDIESVRQMRTALLLVMEGNLKAAQYDYACNTEKVRAIVQTEERAKRASKDFWLSMMGKSLLLAEEVAFLYFLVGIDAALTSPLRKGGFDLIIEEQGIQIPIQCKAFAYPVGEGVVREFLGAIVASEFDRGIIIALSGVTSAAKEIADNHRIQIMKAEDLADMANETDLNGASCKR